MKKLIMIIALAFFSTLGNAQIKGIDLSKPAPFKMENWGMLSTTDNVNRFICYQLTPVGLKKCIEKVRELLIANDKSFDDTFSDKTIISSTVKDLYDYEQLHTTLSIGYSEIAMGWLINDMCIFLGCTDGIYVIHFIVR